LPDLLLAETLPLVLLVPVLLFAGYSDLRWLRIPNRLSILALGLFAVIAVTLPTSELFSRAIAASSVFGIGLALFALRLLGAGDVKLLSVLVLFVPTGLLASFGQIFAAMLLLGTALIVAGRRSHLLDGLGWKSIDTPGVFPMGISISMTGIIFLGIMLAG
jgi:prepilin peptidase CpaA